jgi:segregation and condensation protein B
MPIELTPRKQPGEQQYAEASECAHSAAVHTPQRLCALLEAALFASPEPIAIRQLAIALEEPEPEILRLVESLRMEHQKPERGLTIREVAGRYQMVTKPEHHQQLREITRHLRPQTSLSMPALQTLAIIAYKQPISAPEIQAIRQVKGAGVLNTLLKRKWIAPAGRKKCSRQALLYKTTRLFLIEFGLRDLNELSSLREFCPVQPPERGSHTDSAASSLLHEQANCHEEQI